MVEIVNNKKNKKIGKNWKQIENKILSAARLDLSGVPSLQPACVARTPPRVVFLAEKYLQQKRGKNTRPN